MALRNFIKASAQFCCKYSRFFWLAVLTDLLFWIPEFQARSSQERCCCQRGQVITWEFLIYICTRPIAPLVQLTILTLVWNRLSLSCERLYLGPLQLWCYNPICHGPWVGLGEILLISVTVVLAQSWAITLAGSYPCWLLPLLAIPFNQLCWYSPLAGQPFNYFTCPTEGRIRTPHFLMQSFISLNNF